MDGESRCIDPLEGPGRPDGPFDLGGGGPVLEGGMYFDGLLEVAPELGPVLGQFAQRFDRPAAVGGRGLDPAEEGLGLGGRRGDGAGRAVGVHVGAVPGGDGD